MRAKAGRAIFLAVTATLLASAQQSTAQGPPAYAPQGWSESDRAFWYSAAQGSRLMPLSWMQALERPRDSELFLSPANITLFRYIPYRAPGGDPLPVGFAVDRQNDRNFTRTRLRWLPGQDNDEPWIGLTCSACHTSEIAAGERRLRIEGAPSLGDYQSFVLELDAAVQATRDDPAKWSRFAARILTGNRNTQPNRARLRSALDLFAALRAEVARMNGRPLDYGFARVDAFGHIFNQTSIFAGAYPPTANLSSAPVSYPFLWNVPQHDLVQWNGSAANKRLGSFDVGAVGRNSGEVVGVFGDVTTERPLPGKILGALQSFDSSVNVVSLVRIESMLGRLQPPAWPADMLGPIDRAGARRGSALFERACASCHAPLERTDLTTPIQADMSYFAADAPQRGGRWPNVPPWTDPVMACNAFSYRANSGRLAGFDNRGTAVGAEDRVISLLSVTVTRAIKGKLKDMAIAALRYPAARLADVPPRTPLQPPPATVSADPFPGLPAQYRQCVSRGWQGPGDAILGYKARPLTGIWATAPYLHNGSVPTLYDLLLPPEQRPRLFWLGTRQYDSARVGFQTAQSPENSFPFRTHDAQGRVIWGNFNGGHDYGNARFSDQDRRDLVEYMKGL